ncbi:hypothetical protein [Ferrimonas aestuarii]|uniref:Uncharacterized protein n=1 Tax=Ferrimonas aestuarii TaxID=2569539 RepID=A0A4U1BKW1_9GAMM|nr:hypothetical protein [Ferrimonas aestuarii]TKB53285.1 hypothetical protein FCL42_14530 [Ferrimonas aestuarii]
MSVSMSELEHDIKVLKHRTEVLQYMLAQAMTVALKDSADKHATLSNLKAHFDAKGGSERSEFAESIFESVRISID